MGRGGCELLEAGANCIRGILCCFCCAVCAGPILLIVGVVLLTAPNNYKENVDAYNAAVNTFNSDYKNLVLQSRGLVSDFYNINPDTSGSQSPLSPSFSGTLPSSDSAENVQGTPMSYPLKSQTNVPLSSSQSASISFAPDAVDNGSSLTPNHVNFTLPAITSSNKNEYLRCSESDIDHRRSCRSLCEKEAGSSCATYSGSGTCYSRSSCSGTCTVRKYQVLSCTTFSINNRTGQVSRSSSGSCLYPFTNNKQPESACNAPSNSAVPVLFMNDQDPFIQIQKILGDTSFSFGLTKSQQRNLALALLGIGAAITAVVVVFAFFLKKMIFKDDQTATKVYATFGRTYTPSGSTPNNTNYSPQAQYGQQPATGNYYDGNHMQNNNNNMGYNNNVQQQQPNMGYQQQQPQPNMYQQQPPQPNMGYQQQQPNMGGYNEQQQQMPPPQQQQYGYSAQPPMMQQQQPNNMGYQQQQPQY